MKKLFIILFALIGVSIAVIVWADILEEIGTYTVIDSGTFISTTTSKVTIVNAPFNADNYVYKDYGENHFNLLDINFDALQEDDSGTNGGWVGAGVSNQIGTIEDFTDGVSLVVMDYHLSPARARAVLYIDTGGSQDDHVLDAPSTVYYFTIGRAAGNDTVLAYVFTDSARETLTTTLSLAGFGTDKYRYAYAMTGSNFASAAYMADGYVENLDFNFSSTTPPASAAESNEVILITE